MASSNVRSTATLVYFVHTGKSYVKGKVIDEAIVSFQDINNNEDLTASQYCLTLSREFSSHPSVTSEDVECYVIYEQRPVRIINFSAVQHGECVYICCRSQKSFLQTYINTLTQHTTSNVTVTMPSVSEVVTEVPITAVKKRKRPSFGNTVEEKIDYHVQHQTDPEYNNTKRR